MLTLIHKNRFDAQPECTECTPTPSRPLSLRYASAQARAKMVDLMRNEPSQPRIVDCAPTRVLDEALRKLNESNFSVEVDRQVAQNMLLHLDWVVKTAVEQAGMDPRIASVRWKDIVAGTAATTHSAAIQIRRQLGGGQARIWVPLQNIDPRMH